MFVLPRLTLSFAWLLVAALLLTQTFAAVHSVVHADWHSHQSSHDQTHDDCEGRHHHGASTEKDGHSLSDLFALHEKESDCRLFDQASHDGALAKVAACLLPFAPPPFSVALFQGNALARWAALFDARGPPLTA